MQSDWCTLRSMGIQPWPTYASLEEGLSSQTLACPPPIHLYSLRGSPGSTFTPTDVTTRGLQRIHYLLLTSTGPFSPSLPVSSQDTDLDGLVHQSLQQQCLPSSSRGQQGPGQRGHGACLGQLTACPGACPAGPTGLSPGDLHRERSRS